MQYGISKGSYIRYIGTALQDFFSFCGWDRQIVTGMNGNTYINEANTKDVIEFQGIKKRSAMENNTIKISRVSEPETFDTFMADKHELASEGNYVLLKDGSWKQYKSKEYLNENEMYARTADGYLRLKEIIREPGVGGSYNNWNISYSLYKYIPQVPDASLNSFEEFSDMAKINCLSGRRMRTQTSDDDLYVDVEIGIKNIEGTTQVMVEQTDSDYPVPYSFLVEDPFSGKFTTIMNKRYPSTFTVTYINENGQTSGNSFTIDLTTSQMSKLSKLDVDTKISSENISYNINSSKCESLNYTIANIAFGQIVETGKIKQKNGTIDISTLENGFYIFSIYDGNNKVSETKWNKK